MNDKEKLLNEVAETACKSIVQEAYTIILQQTGREGSFEEVVSLAEQLRQRVVKFLVNDNA